MVVMQNKIVADHERKKKLVSQSRKALTLTPLEHDSTL